MNEDFLNDNVIIPEDIMKMSKDEVEREITRLEQEIKEKKAEHSRKIS